MNSWSATTSTRRPPPAVRHLRRTLFLIAALFGGFVDLGATGRPIRFDHLTLEEGLSQSTVLCIHQDSRGFMWFGTEDGLNRYDGYIITQYKNDPSDPGSLPHDYILSIVEDASGDLWIATDGGGISRWDHTTDSFVTYDTVSESGDGLPSDLVRDLEIDRNGVLWIATRDAGLASFDPGSGA